MEKNEALSALLRPNIRAIVPYSTARDECNVAMDVYMDANESPYPNGVNRYPSPYQSSLKERLSVLKRISSANIFLGNGSDEAIDLIFRTFCEPGVSSMVQMIPTYGMYSVSAAVNDVRVISCPLEDDFSLDSNKLLSKVESDTKVIFICSPNNPTGNLIDRNTIIAILDNFDGIVVVDEAYMDFAIADSLSNLIKSYPRLIILQTLSKAWGMAGLRIGLAIADEFIVNTFSKIKYPYNISVLNQNKAEEILSNAIDVQDNIAEIILERKRLSKTLLGLPCVSRVYPSDANFLLVRFKDKEEIFNKLLSSGIIVRDRSSAYGCKDCLRISIGTVEENDRLLKVLGAVLPDEKLRTIDYTKTANTINTTNTTNTARQSSWMRNTSETTISVRVNLDVFKKPSISTGLNFFNHMLEQIAYHGGIGLDIICFGDLWTDDHHTIEDVAVVLGACIKKALGDKSGISRYGFCLPMDDAEAFVLLDLGGRIDFLWEVELTSDKIGDVSSQMFRHFFKSLSESLCCNLHIKAAGMNDHHIIEGVFKAFARALKTAVDKGEASQNFIPSTKGMI